jgi:hypothetical protein
MLGCIDTRTAEGKRAHASFMALHESCEKRVVEYAKLVHPHLVATKRFPDLGPGSDDFFYSFWMVMTRWSFTRRINLRNLAVGIRDTSAAPSISTGDWPTIFNVEDMLRVAMSVSGHHVSADILNVWSAIKRFGGRVDTFIYHIAPIALSREYHVWYKGAIDRETAERELASKPIKALIRTSSQEQLGQWHVFTLSHVLPNNTFNHARIFWDQERRLYYGHADKAGLERVWYKTVVEIIFANLPFMTEGHRKALAAALEEPVRLQKEIAARFPHGTLFQAQ